MKSTDGQMIMCNTFVSVYLLHIHWLHEYKISPHLQIFHLLFFFCRSQKIPSLTSLVIFVIKRVDDGRKSAI